ncbi:hypothetical protein MSM1_15330 [Mycobacterium sp. SM1]|uniref:rhomboid-like protein n=1 Tax=Mycobacterium sp. SM1 TaxID=2816243 RepID=UPI001BCE8438|nr:rhomboid-like protein [Mycobacterium sp. SM1]MBS4729659.1 hypothetical protein [Mycobacterium sp. SM1]
MIYGLWCALGRVRFTAGYVAALVSVSTTLVILGPRVRAQAVQQASTNLHNLAHGNLESLLGSALIADTGSIYAWLPGLICLLALAELLWRSGRLLIAFVVGHIGTTLVVAAGLAAAVELGWLPFSITRASDVGMSYGALAVLGALTTAIPARWRPAWIGWWVPVGLAGAVVGADFTGAGHAIALVLGMLLSAVWGRPDRWTPARYRLLVVAVVFGFMVLAHTGWSVLTGVFLGALGALLADGLTRFRGARRSSAPTALAAPQPATSG